ncbi:hypothetical protein, partial [Paracoccus marcusii]|uniref:hypothetical protein n=1 Tax=Paracoccus marcusii TaxID=59779 RepID=UPI0024939EE5
SLLPVTLPNITLAHRDAVGRGYPPHQFWVEINKQLHDWAEAAAFDDPDRGCGVDNLCVTLSKSRS